VNSGKPANLGRSHIEEKNDRHRARQVKYLARQTRPVLVNRVGRSNLVKSRSMTIGPGRRIMQVMVHCGRPDVHHQVENQAGYRQQGPASPRHCARTSRGGFKIMLTVKTDTPGVKYCLRRQSP
jgi:hypothetical protein